MARYYAGISGDVTFDGVTLHVVSWSFNDEASPIESTHKSSGGFYKLFTGKRKGSGSFEALWDGDITYGDPPCIRSGNSGTANLLVSNDSGSEAVTGTAVVISCEYSHDLDDAFRYTVNFEMDGEYKVPSET